MIDKLQLFKRRNNLQFTVLEGFYCVTRAIIQFSEELI